MNEGRTYGIFLSHGGSDGGGYAARLRSELEERLAGGRVFSGVDPAYSGEGWRERLDATLGGCSVLVALIGPDWLLAVTRAEQSPNGRDERVRVELEAGLRRGVPLISAVVGGATMPTLDELPPSLQALHAWEVALISDENWQQDLVELVDAIERTRTAAPLQVGDIFAGHRIEALLGRGGMGVVYRARHLGWDRSDAIKVISPELARRWEIRQRFIRESQLAASFRHDNVVVVYDAGAKSGLLYLTMQLVEGSDLAALLALEGPVSPELAVEILAPIADALALAHEHGLIHRDVKPGNILIEEKNGTRRAYLSDFGIARDLTSASSTESNPQLGSVIGSMDYMAPEQIKGEAVGGGADVYALGCILFEMLTGHPPYWSFQGMRILWAHLQESPPALAELRPDLPSVFGDVIGTAMARDPADRPSAANFAATLRALLRGEMSPGIPEEEASTAVTDSIARGAEAAVVRSVESVQRPQHEPRRTGIFICYRRDDARWQARALAEALRDRFGSDNVFMDVDTVRVGNWRSQINQSLDASVVVVVLIGPDWMQELDKRSETEDEVRYEIATAIQRHMQLLPVICGNAPIPERGELPGDIAALVDQEAYHLGEDKYWRPMVKVLIDDLAAVLEA